MPVTLKDVAEQSGLSLQTVSRILTGKGERHLPETRERVLAIASELGYKPNSSAKAMRRGRFGSVALLLSENPALSLLPAGLRDGVLDTLIDREIDLILARFPDTTLTSGEKMPRILREMMVDGLLINYNADFPEAMVRLIDQHHLPAIWINSRQHADCIFPDDFQAGRTATDYLLSLGHRRIAFHARSPVGHYSYDDRQQGYREAMESAGLPHQTVVGAPDLTNQESVRASVPWLVSDERPTAFVTYAVETVAPLLCAAMMLGLSIPGQVSAITFAECPYDTLGLDVDTMVIPVQEIGKRSVEMLLEKIENPSQRLSPCSFPVTLVRGSTCGPPGK